jgi:hypothetical protein
MLIILRKHDIKFAYMFLFQSIYQQWFACCQSSMNSDQRHAGNNSLCYASVYEATMQYTAVTSYSVRLSS